MNKEELKKIVRKSSEEVWYNMRSVDPVNDQTEIITENIWNTLGGEKLKLLEAAPDLYDACKEFVRKVESGEAKCKRSYQQMKTEIEKIKNN